MSAQEKTIRKLSAILSADVKGYSRLMTDDESLTIQTLKAYQSLMTEKIKQHSGRVVDAPGDNLLAEFSSAVNAVQCSVEIQKELKRRNLELPDDKRLEFRIGVNIGDVVQDGDRLYGEGVNIAARIEGLADSGGVCISRNAYDHVKNKLKLGYEYFGEHSVKNIKDPVRVYKVLMAPEDAGKLIGEENKPVLKTFAWSTVIVAGIIFIAYLFYQQPTTPEFEPASIQKMALTLPDKPSIAVLPFDNMSSDSDQEYFCDGFTDEIITSLAKIPDIFVVARNATFVYKGKPVKIKQVSEDLGVHYILEGGIQKVGDQIRVNIQLIDAIKGYHVWAERYDGKLENVFELQDKFTRKIVAALAIKLTPEKKQSIADFGTQNIEAYDAYLQALSHISPQTSENLGKAVFYLKKAIELDPNFIRAHARIASTYNVINSRLYAKDLGISDAHSLMKKHLQIALKTPSASAFRVATFQNLFSGKVDIALDYAEQAFALEPNDVNSNLSLGGALIYAGRSSEAIPFIEKAMRINPKYPAIYLFWLGVAQFCQEQMKKAAITFDRCRKRNPHLAPYFQIAAYEYIGRSKDSPEIIAQYLKIRGWEEMVSIKEIMPWYQFKNPKDRELLVNGLKKAGFHYTPALPLPDKPSIAVLAFDNMTGDSTLEYFSDGIAEEIINVLSNVKELFVIANNSSFSYKGKSVKVQQISKELGVRYILEGSVRKSGNKVRVTTQLIDAANGQHLWSQSYDRNFDNIFEIQDEISMQVVSNLRIKLTEGEQARITQHTYRDPEIYIKHLRWLANWRKGSREGLERCGQLSQEIVDIAPESGLGYRLMGWYHYGLANVGKSPKENTNKAFEMAQKALTIDKFNGSSHSLLGWVYLLMKKYEKAIDSGKRSVEFKPNGALVHMLLGSTLGYAGHFDEAIVYLKQAIRLNPYPAYFYYYHLGRCYMFKEQFGNALTEYQKVVQRAPKLWLGHWSLAINYIYLDRNEKARASVTKAVELNPQLSVSWILKVSKYNNPAHTQYLIEAMRKAGFPE